MSEQAESLLAELESAIAASDADRAAESALCALRGGVPAIDVLRTSARSFASRYEASHGAPRPLAALSSAWNLRSVMQPDAQPFPLLQGVSFAAAENKAKAIGDPAPVVSGEVTHLGRSFLFAVRAAEVAEAESIYLGMVPEGRERRMAGDILFRAALEDMGEGGRKLMIAVKSWQLARCLGFKDARSLLRPAVRYLVTGPRDRAPYESILGVLGREWVDLEALASGGGPLDDAGRSQVRGVASAPDPSSAIVGTLTLLREGYAPTSIAEGLAVEAARRVLAARGYDLETARALMFAHAARFVLRFTRTGERLYALFQAALRVRSPEPSGSMVPEIAPSEGGDPLGGVAQGLDARNPLESATRAGAFLNRESTGPRLLEFLANRACLDSSVANGGINLIFADVCTEEFRATRAPEIPMALAKMIAASPMDPAAYSSWAARLVA